MVAVVVVSEHVQDLSWHWWRFYGMAYGVHDRIKNYAGNGYCSLVSMLNSARMK